MTNLDKGISIVNSDLKNIGIQGSRISWANSNEPGSSQTSNTSNKLSFFSKIKNLNSKKHSQHFLIF